MQSMQALEKLFTFAERVFAIAGYLPIISTLSGFTRILLSLLHLQAAFWIALATGIVGVVAEIGGKAVVAARCFYVAESGVRHLANAVLNIGRGFVEIVPLVGNAICFLYDLARRSSAPIIAYLPKAGKAVHYG